MPDRLVRGRGGRAPMERGLYLRRKELKNSGLCSCGVVVVINGFILSWWWWDQMSVSQILGTWARQLGIVINADLQCVEEPLELECNIPCEL